MSPDRGAPFRVTDPANPCYVADACTLDLRCARAGECREIEEHGEVNPEEIASPYADFSRACDELRAAILEDMTKLVRPALEWLTRRLSR